MVAGDTKTLLRPGDTCWRIERADRFAVIIDAADYFLHLRSAILGARRSVLMIGWDFDTRIDLVPHGEAKDGAPEQLGEFLKHAIQTNPDLHIHILKWDLGTLQTLGRGSTPLTIFGWLTDQRIHFKLDGAHPSGSSHHQKIVVIDDQLAFCGGIDVTAGRWDTRNHLDDDPRRKRPTSSRQYGPWHDMSTAVQGPVARALGDLARERWERATGERLEPPPPVAPDWPKGLEPLLDGVDVAISRTLPEHDGHPQISEIEALYLTAIGAARRTLYIESQYFASRRIADAIVARMAEPDPPEIVVVNPETADGWLEEEVMGAARAALVDVLHKADRLDRFRIYHPVTEEGHAIYVHAKVLIMDDCLLRVGSSNLNNRSLGFDTECDLSVHAAGSEKAGSIRRRIVELRNDLLAEHLGTSPDTFAETVEAEGGSLIAAIESLRGAGRTLVPFEPPDYSDAEKEFFEGNGLLDPERPSKAWRPFSLEGLLGRD